MRPRFFRCLGVETETDSQESRGPLIAVWEWNPMEAVQRIQESESPRWHVAGQQVTLHTNTKEYIDIHIYIYTHIIFYYSKEF